MVLTKKIIFVFHIFLISLKLHPAKAQTWIKAGYWDSSSEFPISHINPSIFTHLLCGFANLDSTSYQLSLTPSEEEQFAKFTVALKQKNPSVTALLSIGGQRANYTNFSSMVSNYSYRKSFIDSSIKMARFYDFQGLDLCWMYPRTGSDVFNMGTLSGEWQDAIELEARNSGQSQLLLTAMVGHSPGNYPRTYPIDSLQRHLNWVHVMATDCYTPMRMNVTGPHAALFDPNSSASTDHGIEEYGGLSSRRLDLCLPCYGFAWTLLNLEDNGVGAPATGPALNKYGFQNYEEILNLIQKY
ncbi:class V chitinase-like [Pistacia vera]|uniref:class V chitinase-like n=1 Tax=Pistacia vera TaxID=55513 RepID=UPI001263A4C2|nr:class V chitinase-like [Pistacia vera]